MICAVIRKYKIRVGYEAQCQQGVLRRGKFIDYSRTISFDESTIGIRRKISKSTVSKRRVAVPRHPFKLVELVAFVGHVL